MDTGTVSVVIPVYNAEKYIRECLDSICRQTWINLEIIAVNDGSSDSSLDILQEAAAGDSRIRVINVPHQGPETARNAGIRLAGGRYLTFIDADDLVEPTYLEQMVRAIGEMDFCVGGYRIWRPDRHEFSSFKGISAVYRGEAIRDHIREYQWLIPGIGWRMYRMDWIRKHQICFPEGICLSEDTIFFSTVLLHAEAGCFIQDQGYIVRRHNSQSLTNAGIFDRDMTDATLRAFRELAEQSANSVFRKEMLYRQLRELSWASGKICYYIHGNRARKKIFFSLADRNLIHGKLQSIQPCCKLEVLTRITLQIRTFFPLYLCLRIRFFRSREKLLCGW